MTKEERHLWYDYLKTLPKTVRRQKVIGNYIVDFYCAEAKLIIELDGSQHFEPTGMKKDAERAAYFESLGLTVLRIPNNAIHQNFKEVCDFIGECLNAPMPSSQMENLARERLPKPSP